jgi:hypothetical protein
VGAIVSEPLSARLPEWSGIRFVAAYAWGIVACRCPRVVLLKRLFERSRATMSRLEVSWLVLTLARQGVESSGGEVERARSALMGTDGALAGTPADGAYAALATTAASVSASFAKASAALATALDGAALAYMIAEQTAASSMTPSGG